MFDQPATVPIDYAVAFPPASKSRKPRSLFQYLTWKGGLRPCGELKGILGTKYGWMIRKNGMSLDHAREACVEEGFLRDPTADLECASESTVADLLELIDAEARGHKQYRESEAALAWEMDAAADDEEAGRLAAPGHAASDQEAREDTRRPAKRQRKSSMDKNAKEIALEMAREGAASMSEIADLAGVSRQLLLYWLKAADIDINRTRAAYLAKEWRKRMK